MEWFVDLLRQNLVIPIFFTLGLGFWLGGLRYKSFTLGPVTATLMVGVIIGQLGFEIPETVKSIAFMLFLFAMGYSVGPQFFRSLRGEGLKQILFAVVEAVVIVVVMVAACRLLGYNKGIAAGLFAGSQTVSALIGVGSDTIRSMGFGPEESRRMIDLIPACYATTYVFGTIGTAWIIANLGPVLLGGLKKVRAETASLEEQMEAGEYEPEPSLFIANRPITYRAYRAESDYFDSPRTVAEIENHIRSKNFRHFIERVRIDGEIHDPDPNLFVHRGDTIVVSGRRESIIRNAGWIGQEVSDHELLTFGAEYLPVTVSKAGAAGITLAQLRSEEFMHGVMIVKLSRDDKPVKLAPVTRLRAGDVITLTGLPAHVKNASDSIGYSDRQNNESDIVFISLGVALGCFIGALVVYFDGVPITLSTSGGAIISGLVLGWLRSRRPSFGHIPRAVTWFLDNAGLNLFIAIVGLSAGPSFIDGLREVGLQLFFVGIVLTFIPLVISIFIATKIFRFPAAVALGCVAGSRNAVAALGAIQDSLDSTLPMMGYTVTYAISSICLIFAGMIVVLFA